MTRYALVVFAMLSCPTVEAQVVDSGSTGADGAFIAVGLPPYTVPSNLPGPTTVECATSTGGDIQLPVLPCTVTIPLREPPNHIFNFTTVTIGPDVTVKFKPNRANTPVFMLATGEVTIDGTIDVTGEPGRRAELIASRGGPGGFSGGLGNPSGTKAQSGEFAGDGLGPGGGKPGPAGSPPGGGLLACFLGCYGNDELQPLIGGSGGEGGLGPVQGWNGGGGGGAILIATSQGIDLGTGSGTAIDASSGQAVLDSNNIQLSGAGSGGAVRLAANRLTGDRRIDVLQRKKFFVIDGRVRFDVPPAGLQYRGPFLTASLNPPGQPIVIFPPIIPTLRIVSIGGVPLSTQPTADAATPDIALPESFSNPVTVVVEATHVPNDGSTLVRVIAHPQYGAGQRVASVPTALTGSAPCTANPAEVCARALVPISLPPSGVGVIDAIIDSVTPVR